MQMSSARVAGAVSVVLTLACFVPVASAQATRTWVSGVGDDANPCSRTAPCKTFAGAISKTATAGEIDTLDPGGFGGVTITKSITIDGTSGIAGVLVSGTNGIIVNASTSSVVILRNLDLNGVGTGTNGINIIAAGDVRIENCKIYGFSQGVWDNRTSGRLAIKDSVISNNAQSGVILFNATASAVAANLDGVQMHGNGNAGFAITSGASAAVSNSSATSNAHGFYADSSAVINLDHSVAFGNSGTGINAQTGASIRLSDTTVSGNGTGLSLMGGSILSYGTNRIFGNAAGNGPPSGTIPVQ
jgi:hypothetical protein